MRFNPSHQSYGSMTHAPVVPVPPTESQYRYSLGDRMTKKQWMLIGGLVLAVVGAPHLLKIWRSK